MSKIYLVGTVHTDFKGPERLRKFLSFTRPNAIGIEASKELIDKRLEERKTIKSIIDVNKRLDELVNGNFNLKEVLPQLDEEGEELSFIIKFLAIQGYEIWSAYEHKKEFDPTTNIYPIHNHEVLTRVSKKFYGILGSTNTNSSLQYILHLLTEKGGFQEYTDRIYLEDDNMPEELLGEVKEYDDIMEANIRDIVTKGHEINAFIAGKAHFFGRYPNNLYARLKDLSPYRLKLIDMDSF